jgi:hypothetical protein
MEMNGSYVEPNGLYGQYNRTPAAEGISAGGDFGGCPRSGSEADSVTWLLSGFLVGDTDWNKSSVSAACRSCGRRPTMCCAARSP